MPGTIERIALATALGLPLTGCYSGFQDFDGQGGPGVGGADAGDAGDAGEDAGDDNGDDGIAAQCLDAPRQIGATALRRLTQDQYRNTIAELLGIDTDVTDSFAPDERVGPFRSNAVAPVVDLQVEQYMDAAELLAEEYVASLDQNLPCDAAAIGDDACAEQWLRDFMPRAYRHPVGDADVARLMEVYAGAAEADGFAMGIQVMLQTMLQSPWFLYHVENGVSAAAGPRRLSGHELASRLSYFLWNTMPDDALFAAATAGELDTAAGIEAQVDRMLADPRAQQAVADFHLQWLGLDELETLEKSGEAYPEFDSDLARAMKEDTASFVRWVFSDGDGRLPTLLTGAFTLSDDPALLALYGVERSADQPPGTPLALPKEERAGLLTQPAVMAWYGHADQSSPVHRGKLIRENFLCQPLPPPPPDVDDVPPDPTPGSTTRERFAEHTENPECNGCHQLIDGLGFGFEHYDGIGGFRTEDQGLPVDASGNVVFAEGIEGDFDGAIELSERLATSADVQSCVARQWFRYSLGRLDSDEDVCATELMLGRFAETDYELSSLVKEIVVSDAFRYRRTAEDSAVIEEGE